MAEAARVRQATADDVDDIVRLVRALAVYAGEPVEGVRLREDIMRRDAFGCQPRFAALLAEHDGRVSGLALYFFSYSTWEGRPSLFLEDLFLESATRGNGLGRAMMVTLAHIAREQNCGRLDLSVLEWNPTREFYHRLGIERLENWLPYRMDETAIRHLAESEASATIVAP